MIKFEYFNNRLLIIFSLLILLNPDKILSQKLNSFKEKIFLEKNGEATIVWDFILEKNSIEQIKFPWNFSTERTDKIVFKIIPNVSSNDNPSVEKEEIYPRIVSYDGVYFILINFSKIPHNTEYRLEFTLPQLFNFSKEKVADFGNYTFRYRFTNTMLAEINNYSSEVILPYGYVITSIDETIPRQTEDNPVSPFQVTNNEKKNSLIIKVPKLKIGEQAFIKMQIKSDKKSMFLLISLVLAGILYLYFFRDLVVTEVNPDLKRK
jgi:hypothetical protein